MNEKPTLYLTGTVHHLSGDKANEKASIANLKGEYSHIIRDDDGTFSVMYLSPQPRYAGQSPYLGKK